MSHAHLTAGALLVVLALNACGDDDGPTSPDAGADADGGADGGAPATSLSFVEIPLADGPEAIADFAFIPGRGREVLVGLHRGTLRHYRLPDTTDAGTEATLLGETTFPVVNDRECGLIALAVDPDFESNRYVYVSHCESVERSVLTRLTLDLDELPATLDSAVEITAIENPEVTAGVHNLGMPFFDEDGSMWLPAGDKASENGAQDPSTNLGTLLHVVPSREPETGGFSPADGEPFEAEALPEVYAYGLRSPWRGSIGAHGIWIGDVGQDDAEELNLVTRRGQNFGWPTYEGPCDPCEGVTVPVVSYDHSSDHPYVHDDPEAAPTRQRAIFVSPEYQPRDTDPYDGFLTGAVLFGDFAVGFVRVLEVDGAGSVLRDRHVGHLQGASAYRVGPDGYFYAAGFGGFDAARPTVGSLYRVELAE